MSISRGNVRAGSSQKRRPAVVEAFHAEEAKLRGAALSREVVKLRATVRDAHRLINEAKDIIEESAGGEDWLRRAALWLHPGADT